jgi:hypothetical protein
MAQRDLFGTLLYDICSVYMGLYNSQYPMIRLLG